jgi:transcriptional regulator of acetoin/glycerol metabolism
MAMFKRHEWPGNVRQLNNVIEASYINTPQNEITVGDLPEMFRDSLTRVKGGKSEADKIRTALNDNSWNISKASKKLNISRMTLYRKMVKYHISRNG